MKTKLALVLAALLLSTGWTIRDLGTLPGGGLSTANAINNGGVIAGQAGNSSGIMRAVWWDTAGVIHEIATPVVPGRFSAAQGINNKGLIVGRMGTTTSEAHAFKWYLGTLTDLTAGTRSIAFAISSSSHIAGQWTDGSTPPKHFAAVWGSGAPGTPTLLSGLGGFVDFASDIVDAPVIAGTSAFAGSPLRRRATLWISGSTRNLGTLGGNNSYGRGLLVGTWPDPGESSIYVVGESETIPGSFDSHAFIYNLGIMRDIGTLPGCTTTIAYAINRLQNVVGTCNAGGSPIRAWLWNGTSMVALDSLLPPGSGWELNVAYDINDLGKIVGYGYHNGYTRAFVMTP